MKSLAVVEAKAWEEYPSTNKNPCYLPHEAPANCPRLAQHRLLAAVTGQRKYPVHKTSLTARIP